MVARTVEPEFQGARRRLVETIRDKGISDLAVLRAFEMTPRHAFVPTGLRHKAYEDSPLPIGSGQTISQPSIHAKYLELLKLTGKERVLEIGTGSGYQTVLLAHLVGAPPPVGQSTLSVTDPGDGDVQYLVVDGGWKLIYHHRAHYEELYHLAVDPREEQDLSSSEPEPLARMRRRLGAELAVLYPDGGGRSLARR